MAQSSSDNILLTFPDIAMLHYRGKDVVTAGKVLVISELLAKITYVEVIDFLLALFPDSNQFFLLPSTDSRDLPLSAMSIEQIEAVIFKKQSNENRTMSQVILSWNLILSKQLLILLKTKSKLLHNLN